MHCMLPGCVRPARRGAADHHPRRQGTGVREGLRHRPRGRTYVSAVALQRNPMPRTFYWLGCASTLEPCRNLLYTIHVPRATLLTNITALCCTPSPVASTSSGCRQCLPFDRLTSPLYPFPQHGLLPSGRCDTREALEEELRLLYVALTRAKDQLHLSMCKVGRGGGGGRGGAGACGAGG